MRRTAISMSLASLVLAAWLAVPSPASAKAVYYRGYGPYGAYRGGAYYNRYTGRYYR